jgi:hypothetical protein
MASESQKRTKSKKRKADQVSDQVSDQVVDQTHQDTDQQTNPLHPCANETSSAADNREENNKAGANQKGANQKSRLPKMPNKSKPEPPPKTECDVCDEACVHTSTCGCGATVCRGCARQGLMSSIQDPCCLQCRTPLSIENLAPLTGKSWLASTFRPHRQRVLLDRQRAMAQETMPFVELVMSLPSMRQRVQAALVVKADVCRPPRSQLENPCPQLVAARAAAVSAQAAMQEAAQLAMQESAQEAWNAQAQLLVAAQEAGTSTEAGSTASATCTSGSTANNGTADANGAANCAAAAKKIKPRRPRPKAQKVPCITALLSGAKRAACREYNIASRLLSAAELVVRDYENGQVANLTAFHAATRRIEAYEERDRHFYGDFHDDNHVNYADGNQGKEANDVSDKEPGVRPCPAADCRGFLDRQWRCLLCKQKTCAQCGNLDSTLTTTSTSDSTSTNNSTTDSTSTSNSNSNSTSNPTSSPTSNSTTTSTSTSTSTSNSTNASASNSKTREIKEDKDEQDEEEEVEQDDWIPPQGLDTTTTSAKPTPTALKQKHVCDPAAAASMLLIRKTSKPCPACGVSIQRISGCTQMWCTACHTSFDERTREIYRQPVHNPERMRWMAEGSRAPLLAANLVTEPRAHGAEGAEEKGTSRAQGTQGTSRRDAPVPQPICATTLIDYQTFFRYIMNVLHPNTRNTIVHNRPCYIPAWPQYGYNDAQRNECPQYRLYDGLQDMISDKLPRLERSIQSAANHAKLRLHLLLGRVDENYVKMRLEHKERKRAHLRQIHDCLCLLRDVGIEAFQYMAHGPPAHTSTTTNTGTSSGTSTGRGTGTSSGTETGIATSTGTSTATNSGSSGSSSSTESAADGAASGAAGSAAGDAASGAAGDAAGGAAGGAAGDVDRDLQDNASAASAASVVRAECANIARGTAYFRDAVEFAKNRIAEIGTTNKLSVPQINVDRLFNRSPRWVGVW